jgi:hypothetical protein
MWVLRQRKAIVTERVVLDRIARALELRDKEFPLFGVEQTELKFIKSSDHIFTLTIGRSSGNCPNDVMQLIDTRTGKKWCHLGSRELGTVIDEILDAEEKSSDIQASAEIPRLLPDHQRLYSWLNGQTAVYHPHSWMSQSCASQHVFHISEHRRFVLGDLLDTGLDSRFILLRYGTKSKYDSLSVKVDGDPIESYCLWDVQADIPQDIVPIQDAGQDRPCKVNVAAYAIPSKLTQAGAFEVNVDCASSPGDRATYSIEKSWRRASTEAPQDYDRIRKQVLAWLEHTEPGPNIEYVLRYITPSDLPLDFRCKLVREAMDLPTGKNAISPYMIEALYKKANPQ